MSAQASPDSDDIVIVDFARTPIGGFQGALKSLTAPELGAVSIAGALARAGIATEDIDQVVMGCVLPAGMGQAPARQAAHGAGISWDAGCITVNKMCGSGMQAAMQASDAIRVGHAETIVAGGLESMSNAPYLLPKARDGYRMGHHQVADHMFLDGLEDAYDPGRLMGTYAEDTAQHFQFTREAQDDYAIASLDRATKAAEDGTFDAEVVPIEVKSRKETTTVIRDEQPTTARPDKIPNLKPAFREQGSVTAANSSSISDGAAALILTSRRRAEQKHWAARARLVGQVVHAQEPAWFTTAPIRAIEKLLQVTGWTMGEIDLFEVNEAFAVVPLAAMHALDIPHDKINVHGGACAIGHPVGASGARIIATLINALEKHDLKKGVAAICIGGGEATAVAVERPA
jgi:acetyl-CoA C-acetyltransferase